VSLIGYGAYRTPWYICTPKSHSGVLGFLVLFLFFCYSGQRRPALYLTRGHYTFVDLLGLALIVALFFCPLYLIVTFIMGEYDADKLEQNEIDKSTKEDE